VGCIVTRTLLLLPPSFPPSLLYVPSTFISTFLALAQHCSLLMQLKPSAFLEMSTKGREDRREEGREESDKQTNG